MAYAPYTNDFAIVCSKPIIRGSIVNECGNVYEFFNVVDSPFDGYNQAIFVGPCGDIRYCNIAKTRAYVVVDEDVNGNPVIEKWVLKTRRNYDV